MNFVRSNCSLVNPCHFIVLLCTTSLIAAQPGDSTGIGPGYEDALIAQGFVDVRELDSTIRVELKYAGNDNFMKENVYGSLKKCFLRREAAGKLAAANAHLKSDHPHLTILVADGFRPRHVQRKMWDLVKTTPMRSYVANPQGGSMHNYGCAVDVTLADTGGNRLDMGTPVDHFGPLAQVRLEEKYVGSGQLTRQQVANRHILRQSMVAAGFRPIAIEWWHFEAFDKSIIRSKYSIVE